MNSIERLEYLRENPIFWSRLGSPAASDTPEEWAKDIERHRAMAEKGIKVHSSIIPLGWVDIDTYCYDGIDQLFSMLFEAVPDIYFLPRLKMEVPARWCYEHPEDLYVYSKGPRTREEILAMVGGPHHGSNPLRVEDLVAQYSFSSEQWKQDASEALRRFVTHMEQSPWGDRIIGYHIGYGTCGETTYWGTYGHNPYQKGDYGVNATKAYIQYAKERGVTVTEMPSIDERYLPEICNLRGKPMKDENGNSIPIRPCTLQRLFYDSEKEKNCILAAQFMMDANVDAIEQFGKTVKEVAPEKLFGVFYGYITSASNCNNHGHTGLDRVLKSPYVDFIASPKGYDRVGPDGPGFGQGVPNSVNRKKLWVDEIDNRTYLCPTNSHLDQTAKDFPQTRAVYWREFSKNIAFHQGYWWMDLGRGWLDAEDIREDIRLLSETSKELYRERDRWEDVAEVLLVIDERTMHHIRPLYPLHHALMMHTGSVVKECGVPIDFYRFADLKEIPLSRYKFVIFLNQFYTTPEEMNEVLSKLPRDCHVMWNYTAGIMNAEDGSLHVDHVKEVTGFEIKEYTSETVQSAFPLISVCPTAKTEALAYTADGKLCLAKQGGKGERVQILNAKPDDMTVEQMRTLLRDAGVHTYAPPYCVVHTDSRFLYMLSEKEAEGEIQFKHPTDCKNVFTGEVYRGVTKVPFQLKEGNGIFLKYLF